MLEGGRAVPGRLGLGHPQLNPLQVAAIAARVLLAVRHAVAGGHQVELTGPDDLVGPQAVAMAQLP